MNIPTRYTPTDKESKWYQYWLENNFFHSVPDNRKAYTIVIPPPNVTGVLHMGHMLNNTIQDVLVRRARMLGKNACWVPGTDHASIATEAKVVDHLKKNGINKSDLSRDEFMKHAWEWREKHGGIILGQLKKLGCSCDWERTKFTMDKNMYDSVIAVFIDLFNKGLIYRGVRMINWDPKAKTAVSDEEVNYREVQSKLYYLRYKVVGSENDWITIATTRPETILGDTAVCVHPADERYFSFVGKKVFIPLINRIVPIIQDEYVDREFGTGCLKITPAHDINDYEIGLRHNLDSVDIFNDDGTMSQAAQLYIGKERFDVRELITKDLEANGHIVKIEDYTNKVGFSERTDAVIEPKLSVQWFMKMKELAKPALDNVLNDNVQLVPAKFKNTYRHWMENVKDWCISRQLWWGQRIPAFFISGTKDFVVAQNIDEALILAKQKTGNENLTINNLNQEEDVLDTWFSSWLWPISVFDGILNPDNEDIKYYYPTNDLITAPEILFFWVARMIMAGYEYIGKKPFENVYLTGIVRDKLGRKMSKSLGNSPEPLELIEKYGADGIRVGMLLCSPAGNDLLFDENLSEQGRNFGNKIWNAFRLLKSWNADENILQPEASQKAVDWFDSMINKSIETLNDQFEKFRISEALMTVYKLFWDEFSSWYLEIIKPAYQQPIDSVTYSKTILFFEKLMKLIHPFMPFITEEIWQLLYERKSGESIMISSMPNVETFSDTMINDFEEVKEIIANVRKIRLENNIQQKEKINLLLKTDHQFDHNFDSIIIKMCGLSSFEETTSKPENAYSFIIKSDEFYIPVLKNIDFEKEIEKLNEELDYAKGFLNSVMLKLENEKFMKNAPAKVVENELNKKTDAESKIKILEERIAGLQNNV